MSNRSGGWARADGQRLITTVKHKRAKGGGGGGQKVGRRGWQNTGKKAARERQRQRVRLEKGQIAAE